MENNHHEAWLQNVREKIGETVTCCHKFMTAEVPQGVSANDYRVKCRDEVLGHLKALGLMFSGNGKPAAIQGLENQVNNFTSSRRTQSVPALLSAIRQLEELMADPEAKFSFGDIFDSYQGDKELDDLADHLVAMLERLIAEGDGELRSRLDRDLRKLLEQLKGRKPHSLAHLGALADIIAKIACEYAGHYFDVPAGAMLVDVAKAAYQLQTATMRKFNENQNEFVRLLEIKSAGPDLALLPAPTEEVIKGIEMTIKEGDKLSASVS